VLALQAKGIDARVLRGGLGGFVELGRPLAHGPNP
jgi:hypothetical protein